MSLINYEKLKEIYECRETKGLVKVVLFSKTKEEYNTYPENISLLRSLNTQNLLGNVGECFLLQDYVLCCIGSMDVDSIVLRTNVRKSAKGFFEFMKKYNQFEINFEDSEFTEDFVYSFIIAGYNYDFLKKEKSSFKFLVSASKYEKIIRIAHSQNIARFLGDTPANLMTPSLFVEYARSILGNNVSIDEYSKDFMKSLNMNLILSVSQGSVEEPKLLKVKYSGRKSDEVDISVVGKGVCFDAGGISLKPAAGMCDMKNDMLGAATLLCAIKLAAELKLPVNITGVFPLVENLPSGSATKPGDVFISMKGLSVEVDNTDAEGRLILADALTYAQQDNPKYLFDAATLTGAMVVALGTVFVGYFTDCDDISRMIMEAAEKTNDLMWRMPLSPFFKENLKSQTADLNNMGGKGAGSSKAAEFLKAFVEPNTKWVHFDIAGMLGNSYNNELHGKYATGRPVPLFIELFEMISKQIK